MKKLLFILLVFSSQSFAQDLLNKAISELEGFTQEKYCYITGYSDSNENRRKVRNEVARCDKDDLLRVVLRGNVGGITAQNMDTVTDIINLHCDFDREIVITEATDLNLQCIMHSKKPRESRNIDDLVDKYLD